MTGTLPTVGLIGLGRMGNAIAQRLIDEGIELHVWNRTAEKVKDIDGAIGSDTPADLAMAVDIILVIVRDATALEDVYNGPAGLCSVDLKGKTVVEMSTAAIHEICGVLEAAQAAGAAVIDAPVSGTVLPARRGELLVMAGGEEEALNHVRPILAKIARKVVHAGPLCTGITMKLVVNLPLASYWQTLGEALGIGLRNGLSLEDMLAVIVDSKAAIGALPSKIEHILNADLAPEFDLAGLAKDLSAMCDSALASDYATPACEAARRSADAAVAAGFGSRDLSQLTRFAADPADQLEEPS